MEEVKNGDLERDFRVGVVGFMDSVGDMGRERDTAEGGGENGENSVSFVGLTAGPRVVTMGPTAGPLFGTVVGPKVGPKVEPDLGPTLGPTI